MFRHLAGILIAAIVIVSPFLVLLWMVWVAAAPATTGGVTP